MEHCDVCGADRDRDGVAAWERRIGDGGAASCGCPLDDGATPLLALDGAAGVGPEAPTTETASRPRRRWPVAVLAAAAVVVAAGLVWLPSGDGGSDEAGGPRAGAAAPVAGPGDDRRGTSPITGFEAGSSTLQVRDAALVADGLPPEIAGLRVALRVGAEVLVIDLGTAEVRSVESSYGASLLGAGGFVLTDTGVVVVDDGVARLIALDGPTGSTADLGDAVDVVGVPGDRRVWLIDVPDAPPGFASAREVVAVETGAYSGANVGFGSRTFASRAVPAGLVVVNVLAGTWIHDGADWRALYDGRSLASSGDVAVVQECRSADTCAAFRIDLATGARVVASRAIATLVADGAQVLLEPEGASAVYGTATGGIGRLDVISGETQVLSSSWGGPTSRLLGLSPGGRWLFGFDGHDRVVAFDLTGAVKGVVVVLDGLDPSADVETFQVVSAHP